MDEQASKQALEAAEKAKVDWGVDVAGFSEVPQPAAAPQPAALPEPPKPVGIRVTNDAMWVYLHIEGKRPYGLTVLNARELALALRQACNRVERGQK